MKCNNINFSFIYISITIFPFIFVKNFDLECDFSLLEDNIISI